jgi:ABC-type amino acid transport system permease subunit
MIMINRFTYESNFRPDGFITFRPVFLACFGLSFLFRYFTLPKVLSLLRTQILALCGLFNNGTLVLVYIGRFILAIFSHFPALISLIVLWYGLLGIFAQNANLGYFRGYIGTLVLWCKR